MCVIQLCIILMCVLRVCVRSSVCTPRPDNPYTPVEPRLPAPPVAGLASGGWVTSSSHLQARQPPPGISPVRGGGAGSLVGEIVGELLSHKALTPPALPETLWRVEGHGLAYSGGSETKEAVGGWPHPADTCWGVSRPVSEREWGPNPIL